MDKDKKLCRIRFVRMLKIGDFMKLELLLNCGKLL